MLKGIKNEELISIIVPIYNVKDYLGNCVNSILKQTYENIEVILVDDGSTDSSGSICDNFALIDSRVSVIHKQNGGLSDARNAGIKNSKGGFIALVDSDDIVCDNFIQTLYEIYLITINEQI